VLGRRTSAGVQGGRTTVQRPNRGRGDGIQRGRESEARVLPAPPGSPPPSSVRRVRTRAGGSSSSSPPPPPLAGWRWRWWRARRDCSGWVEGFVWCARGFRGPSCCATCDSSSHTEPEQERKRWDGAGRTGGGRTGRGASSLRPLFFLWMDKKGRVQMSFNLLLCLSKRYKISC
jgi:hypothetical protein